MLQKFLTYTGNQEGKKSNRKKQSTLKQLFVLLKTPSVFDRGKPDTLFKGKNLPLKII